LPYFLIGLSYDTKNNFSISLKKDWDCFPSAFAGSSLIKLLFDTL